MNTKLNNAIATAEKVSNATVSRATHDDRSLLLEYLSTCEKIAELEKLKKQLFPEVVALFETQGVTFDHSAEKSTCFALAYRKENRLQYAVYRKGEQTQAVDYKAYAEAQGETAETLKSKGYFTVRKGTEKIERANKSQFASLLALFGD